MTKVQSIDRSLVRLLTCAMVLLTAAALASCRQSEPPADGAQESGRFGDPYQIVTNVSPDAPDEPPAIAFDSLFVQVGYSGGCEEHAFDLDYQTARDTTRIWLRHDDGGDSCEAMINDRLAFELPDDAREGSVVLLVNPNYDEPFVLRWSESP